MTPRSYSVMIFLGLALVLQGCGESKVENNTSQTEQLKKSVANLQLQLDRARQALSTCEDRNKPLVEKLRSPDKQETMANQGAAEKLTEDRTETRELAAKESRGEGRIALMGAKAVAEYKAQQLSKRLDKLSKDVELKEQELATIKRDAEAKDNEVATLSRQIESLQAADKARVSELQAKLEKIEKELGERSSVVDQLNRQLAEKSDLVNTLKTSISDATKLKSNAENEVDRLQSELAQATSQAEAAGKEVDQLHNNVSQLQNQAVRFQEEMDHCRQQSEELRADAKHDKQENHNLRAQLAKLSRRLKTKRQASVVVEQEHPSAIDRILQGSQASRKSSLMPGLY